MRGDQREQQERRCSRPEGGDLPVMSRDSEPTGPELTSSTAGFTLSTGSPWPTPTRSQPAGKHSDWELLQTDGGTDGGGVGSRRSGRSFYIEPQIVGFAF